jgi:hypothetical protein
LGAMFIDTNNYEFSETVNQVGALFVGASL